MQKILFLLLASILPLSVFAQDNGSNEIYWNEPVYGCTQLWAPNFNPEATINDGSCEPSIVGCTDTTALNYNKNATIHQESICQYAAAYTPQNIEGSFEKSQVSIGATTWTVRFNLNVTGATLDPSSIQTWNRFTAVSSTSNEKTLTVTLRQFDDQRLDVECTNYEVTIPRRALTTTQGDTNANPIIGNFEVVGCEKSSIEKEEQQDEKEEKKHENTIKENNFYLSLYDTDEKGKVYINLTNIIYLLGFLSFFTILFFILFWFIKNSFLWKSKK